MSEYLHNLYLVLAYCGMLVGCTFFTPWLSEVRTWVAATYSATALGVGVLSITYIVTFG